MRRNHLLQDVVDAYRLNPALVHHRLTVVFDGEEAVDLDGVTRELFVTAFDRIMETYFVGANEAVPVLDHRFLFTGIFEVIGRILSHTCILVNYIPPKLCRLLLAMVGCGSCSDEFILESFLSYLTEEERTTINTAMDVEAPRFNDSLRMKLISFISNHDGRVIPTPETIKQTVVEIAKTELIVKTMYQVSSMKKGMDCYPLLWQGVGEDVVNKMMEVYQPTTDKILAILELQYSDDNDLRQLEKRVKGYMERFVSTVENDILLCLLRFWTAADTLCIRNLKIGFNSNEGLMRRPIANTCTTTLQLSRLYFSFEDFSAELKTVLSDKNAFTFDSI